MSIETNTHIAKLKRIINYHFHDNDLLIEALTHPSLTKYSKVKQKNYQRLEFLGNGILGAILAELLYNLFPQASEGELSVMHSKLASTQGIVNATKDIVLNDYIQMHASEKKNGGLNNPRNIEDCAEALIGAIYIDGGYKAAQDFVKKFWSNSISSSQELHIKDIKSQLQEFCQKQKEEIPQYTVITQEGSAHTPTFEIECKIRYKKNELTTIAKGKNKKEAEQSAAIKMFKTLKENYSIL